MKKIMKKYYIKSLFGKWKQVTQKEAKDFAKYKFKNVYMGAEKEQYVLDNIINQRLKNIKFTITDLIC